MSAAKLSVQEAVVTGERRNLSHAKLLRLLRQRKSHLLQRLPDHVLQRIAESNLNSGLSMAENQKIMKEGDLWDPPWLWFVYEGKVDVKDMKVNLLIATVGPGSLVGEFSAVTGERHVADAFAKDKSVLVKLDVEEIEHLMPENPKFFANLVSERLEMAAFYQELNQGVDPIHDEVGILPSDLSMPAMSDYMKNKSSRAFAANVAAYKRLLRMAVKARVGTANVCVFFASQEDLRSPFIELDKHAMVATKIKPDRGLLDISPCDGQWGSIMLLPDINAPAQVYVEFLIELSNPVCEALFGVCDGSQNPGAGQITFKRSNAWMYYCHNGRKYTKGVGFDISPNRISGTTAAQGDRVGILIDQSVNLSMDPQPGAEGKCAALYINGKLQGLLVSERLLAEEHEAWPERLFIAMDLHGDNQRVRILPERTRVLGLGVDVQATRVVLQGRQLPSEM